MRILAIETSCDETSIALVKTKGGIKNPRFKILKNLVASQIKIHKPFGGVVPNLAKREHIKNLPILLEKTLNSKFYILNSIDIIAVTIGPGLEPCLWTGITFAKQMYADLRRSIRGLTRNKKVKLIGVNHLEAHLYSNWLPQQLYEAKPRKIEFPAVDLIISGGHTILLLMKSLTNRKKLGETRDDAVGEAFDKVARMLELPYPGGPEIEKLAKIGSPTSIDFPRPMINQKNYDFSFSGLKTAVLYYLRDNLPRKSASSLRKSAATANVAAAFQQAAFDVIIAKTLRAAKEFSAKSILISGGVSVNKTLQKQFKKEIKNRLPLSSFHFPISSLCGDNAAMIAAAGYINFLQKKNCKLIARSNLNL